MGALLACVLVGPALATPAASLSRSASGAAAALPALVRLGVVVSYSVPGNTYSVGKTDFWTYAQALFGVALPPDIGLTGRGLSGTLTVGVADFSAEGIPITPFPDAAPTGEDPYQ